MAGCDIPRIYEGCAGANIRFVDDCDLMAFLLQVVSGALTYDATADDDDFQCINFSNL